MHVDAVYVFDHHILTCHICTCTSYDGVWKVLILTSDVLGLPDEKAWGSGRSKFYGADVDDEDDIGKHGYGCFSIYVYS